MTDLTTALAGATTKQAAFITSLLAERDFALGSRVVNSPREASALIEDLLAAPRKPKAERPADALTALLNSVQKSKYALAVDGLLLMDERVNGDLLFVEVKEYNGHRYLRRLHGSVGDFTRTKMSREDSLIVLNAIARDPYAHARAFGEHFRCCGKCAAPLTDERSRALQLGPDCRKEFGL